MIDSEALVDALKTGLVSGAGLDVVEETLDQPVADVRPEAVIDLGSHFRTGFYHAGRVNAFDTFAGQVCHPLDVFNVLAREAGEGIGVEDPGEFLARQGAELVGLAGTAGADQQETVDRANFAHIWHGLRSLQ